MTGARVAPWWLLPPALLFGAGVVLAATGDAPRPEEDAVYQGDLLVGGLVQAALFVAYCFLATWRSHVSAREALALRRPPAAGTARLVGAVFAALLVANLVLEPLTHAGEEQGIAPTRDPRGDEWLLFALALVVLAVAAPISEELVFRGLGFAALPRFPIPLTAALFAAAHQLPELLAPVFVAGLVLGWLRARTDSILPGILVHAALNATGLLVALAVA